ncbi:PREDICTED: uncharacterized protein LOC106330896 [Brassica oleracea var. oleracea]|uniref:uncharacterized protein LOC106330896 n=1 Tax=Brassica oleracea var. oleracea TaxID=109376 RepID=UPI0006A70961|nr:PREDICTED: uncharacterized protein LOC106330896 [Brassica oleracea var. oleracea]
MNPGTKTCVKLDDASKFKYLFIALGACIEGFAFMRKVIAMDATWLKNRYGGVLVFAKAQDPNSHSYPLAFAVQDGENLASWTWFFEMLKSVIPDSSELVFMSERNQSLIFAIGNVFPQAHHGHCLWHLKKKVKWHACNVNENIVRHRFMELGRYYTVGDFNSAYDSFKKIYPAVYKYVEEHTEKDKWARKFSDWFTQRKDAVCRSIGTRLVPVVENHLHDLWAVAQQLSVRELNSYELKYEITDTAGRCFGRAWLENLVLASRLNIHELCSKYYWTELWALAYDRTLYVVPDMSSWNVPDQIDEVKIIPPDRITGKGRKRVKTT